MTENLQKAYDAYQQALVNLRDPKVSFFFSGIIITAPTTGITVLIFCNAGPYALVWHRYPL